MPNPCLAPNAWIDLDLDSSSALVATPLLSARSPNGLTLETDGLWAPTRPNIINYGGVLPAAPDPGQEIHYTAFLDNPVMWQLRYFSGEDKWRCTGGIPIVSEVPAAENRAAGGSAYADLTTVGPSVTLPLNGNYLVSIGTRVNAGSAGNGAYMAPFVAGTMPGDNANAVTSFGDKLVSISKQMFLVGFSAGDVMKCRYSNLDSSNPAQFSQRWISVIIAEAWA